MILSLYHSTNGILNFFFYLFTYQLFWCLQCFKLFVNAEISLRYDRWHYASLLALVRPTILTCPECLARLIVKFQVPLPSIVDLWLESQVLIVLPLNQVRHVRAHLSHTLHLFQTLGVELIGYTLLLFCLLLVHCINFLFDVVICMRGKGCLSTKFKSLCCWWGRLWILYLRLKHWLVLTFLLLDSFLLLLLLPHKMSLLVIEELI